MNILSYDLITYDFIQCIIFWSCSKIVNKDVGIPGLDINKHFYFLIFEMRQMKTDLSTEKSEHSLEF